MIDPPDAPDRGPDEHDADLFDDEDGDGTIDCPACGASIYADTERCPQCGHWIIRDERLGREDRRQRLWKWIAGLLVLLLVLWLVFLT